MFSNKREEFIQRAGQAIDAVKEEMAYAYQRRDETPTPEKCSQAADYIQTYCKAVGVDVSASVSAFGRQVHFIVAPKKGASWDTSIMLMKIGEKPEPVAITHINV